MPQRSLAQMLGGQAQPQGGGRFTQALQAPPAQQADDVQSAWQQVLKENPRMAGWGIEVGRGPQSNNTAGGHIEYYPPDEEYNPRPGKPYLEVYDQNTSPDQLKQLLYGDALHHAYRADPKFNDMREQFRQTLSPEQLQLSQQRYKDFSDPKSQYYDGENRSYQDFFEKSDLDAIIRGKLANQWPADMYSPEESSVLDQMGSYLRGDR